MPLLPYRIEEHENGVSVSVCDALMTAGRWKTMVFPGVSLRQMVEARRAYDAGAYIQTAFDFITPSQREFLMTGLSDQEFDQLFPDDDEEVWV